MKVLIPIDGSPNSLRALEYVISHRDIFGSAPTIALIYVHLPIPSARAKAFLGAEVLDQYYADETQAALTPARELLTKHGLSATEVWLVGNPGSEIAKAALTHDCRMIVMGTHGHGAVGNLLLGSVTTRTIAESTVPVLLVK
ncbi:MAG: universal stress protein [Betaproteobacteria bacterium]|nr:universal stress protein [Betaproteobacteria bacterium]